jgi:2-oxoisovalerate dehydrogenase E2 component (dihydrolipoyl transacylase)
MSPYVFKLPDVGEGVAEAEVIEWLVSVGDAVTEGDPFVEVMTDKASVELPAPVDGRVEWLGAEVGEVVPVGAELARFAPLSGPNGADGGTDGGTDGRTVRTLAPPAVRRRAANLGLDLARVGPGPDGWVRHEDLDRYLFDGDRQDGDTGPGEPRRSAQLPGRRHTEEIPMVGLRRSIARHMEEAWRHVPHFTYIEEVDVTELDRLRRTLADEWTDDADADVAPGVLAFVMRAVVVAVRRHPEMNATYDPGRGAVTRHGPVHLGIAVQTERGLVVPVVRDADHLDVRGCATELARLSEAARSASASRDELSGSTITISSLGALGGVAATPIVNHPEVAIIGVNRMVERPVVIDGTVVVRRMMNLSSSFDHRVVDGWDAARFVQRVRALLETPALLFAS